MYLISGILCRTGRKLILRESIFYIQLDSKTENLFMWRNYQSTWEIKGRIKQSLVPLSLLHIFSMILSLLLRTLGNICSYVQASHVTFYKL